MQNNNKSIIIIVSAILLVSFFLPWINFFVRISAWEMLFGKMVNYIDTDFKYIAVLIPLTSIIIIYCAAFNNEKYPISKGLLFIMPMLTLIVISMAIVFKIDSNAGRYGSADLESIIKVFGIGFWLTVISSFVLPFINSQSTTAKRQGFSTSGHSEYENDKLRDGAVKEQIPETPVYARPQVNINLPKVNWEKAFDKTNNFMHKHKIILLSGAGVLIAFVVFYNLFIKTDPVKDGKTLAKTYCSCSEELNKSNSTALQLFLDGFGKAKYRSRAEAKKMRDSLLLPNQANYNTCTQEAAIRYKEKYADYNAAGGNNVYIFEQTYTSITGVCNSADYGTFQALKSKTDDIIKTISDPEPDIEKVKSDLLGHEIPGWSFDYLNEFEKITIAGKTRSGDRLELDVIVNLEGQTAKDKHEAQIYIVYYKGSDDWNIGDVKAKYITYDNVISPDSWTQIIPLTNTSWTADNLHNLVWKTYEYGEEFHSGPGKPGVTLPNSNVYFIKSEEGKPVTVKFTYKPNN
jgi:hypothetical protein